MKKFLIKITKFLLPVILIILMIEFFLIKIPNDYQYKSDFLSKNAQEIETLILGSSHSFYGIDPSFFDSNSFNCAIIAQTLEYDFEIFEKYKEEFNDLELLILPISSFTLFSRMKESKEPWRKKNYSIYYGIDLNSTLEDKFEILSNGSQSRFNRLVSYYILGNKYKSCNELGWGTKYKSIHKKDLETTAAKVAKYHNYDVEKDNVKFNLNQSIDMLEDIIQWCKLKNIKVMLLTPPASEAYRNKINKEQLNIMFDKS